MSSKFSAAAVAAGVVMLASVGTALASPAMVTSNVNVRSGPGANYGVVDIVRRGEFVDLVGCQNAWCYIDKYGSEGWISAAFVDLNSATQRPAVGYGFNIVEPPPPSRHGPSYSRPYEAGREAYGASRGGWERERNWGGRGDWNESDPWGRKFRATEWY
jgi:uncharacterized protein YraI